MSLNALWARRHTTKFNGASLRRAARRGGGVLAGGPRADQRADRVLHGERAADPRGARRGRASRCFGGVHAPYIWLRTPGGATSWELLRSLLDKAQVVGTPGAGLRPGGRGLLPASARSTRARTSRKRSAHPARVRLIALAACGGSALACLVACGGDDAGAGRRRARRRQLDVGEAVLRQRDEPLSRDERQGRADRVGAARGVRRYRCDARLRHVAARSLLVDAAAAASRSPRTSARSRATGSTPRAGPEHGRRRVHRGVLQRGPRHRLQHARPLHQHDGRLRDRSAAASTTAAARSRSCRTTATDAVVARAQAWSCAAPAWAARRVDPRARRIERQLRAGGRGDAAASSTCSSICRATGGRRGPRRALGPRRARDPLVGWLVAGLRRDRSLDGRRARDADRRAHSRRASSTSTATSRSATARSRARRRAIDDPVRALATVRDAGLRRWRDATRAARLSRGDVVRDAARCSIATRSDLVTMSTAETLARRASRSYRRCSSRACPMASARRAARCSTLQACAGSASSRPVTGSISISRAVRRRGDGVPSGYVTGPGVGSG